MVLHQRIMTNIISTACKYGIKYTYDRRDDRDENGGRGDVAAELGEHLDDQTTDRDESPLRQKCQCREAIAHPIGESAFLHA